LPLFLSRARDLLVGLATMSCAGAGAAEMPPTWAPSPPAHRAAEAGTDLGLSFWVPAHAAPPAAATLLRAPEREAPGADEPTRSATPLREIAPRPADAPRYTLLSGVTLAAAVQEKVSELAAAYFRRTGKELVVTSGTRDPERQAEAVHELFQHGADVLRLYKDKSAARELKSAYEQGVSAAQPVESLVASLADVIRAQVDRGVFISAHLREGAVDIRSRDMTSEEKRAFLDGAEEVEGLTVLEESRPPHYHLQID
jgi:hypothetical protein